MDWDFITRTKDTLNGRLPRQLSTTVNTAVWGAVGGCTLETGKELTHVSSDVKIHTKWNLQFDIKSRMNRVEV